MQKLFKIMALVALVAGLVLVRMFEEQWFYDPLLKFFKTNHSTQPLPELDQPRLLLNIALRFLVNTLLSLVLLWVVFRNRGVLKIASLLYAVLFVLLMVVFIVLLNTSQAGDHMALFYVRRFIIQPIFLLILLPAFYFQKRR